MPNSRKPLSNENGINQSNNIDVLELQKQTILEKEAFVQVKDVTFSYYSEFQDNTDSALNHISIEALTGQHIAILGRNGSGKSTMAKLINGLLLPDQGEVLVLGKNTADEDEIWSIRQICGMVFQNPDNQIVGTTVEEDVAFGPENLGVPSPEIRIRVDDALSEVGLSNYAIQAPSSLSGGQKQKLAIAGILAMKPQCIILDEATSMLDPQAAKDLMELISTLKEEYNLTILDITHDVENAISADYIYVLQQGEILIQGTPREVFSKPGKVLSAGLELPKHLLTLYSLMNHYSSETLSLLSKQFSEGIFSVNDTVKAIQFLMTQPLMKTVPDDSTENEEHSNKEYPEKSVISVQDLSFSYQKDSEHEVQALKHINFEIKQGELVTIIGHSGSGKSTLISHLNGLTIPQKGKVLIGDLTTSEKKNIPAIRKQVGLLFQYPEHQLFENTVYEDIAFGPKQFKIPKEEMERNIKKAIKIVNLDEELLTRSPFELSGGQQRRVAIAGVIATNCDIFVLDEPAAGLDPIGKNEIFSYISELRKTGKTIILVSHDMNLVAEISDRILVLQEGELQAFDTREKIFSDPKLLKKAGLAEPAVYHLSKILSNEFSTDLIGFTAEDVKIKLLKFLQDNSLDNINRKNFEKGTKNA